MGPTTYERESEFGRMFWRDFKHYPIKIHIATGHISVLVPAPPKGHIRIECHNLTMDWTFLHKAWDKWVSNNVGSSGEPLKAALLINYDPTGPSRLLSIVAEQEGIIAKPLELSQFLDFFQHSNHWRESFVIGPNQYLVTSIHENWFCARCINTAKPAGEGAIVMQTAAFLFVGLYDGSIGSASRAVVAADQLAWQLGRKNL